MYQTQFKSQEWLVTKKASLLSGATTHPPGEDALVNYSIFAHAVLTAPAVNRCSGPLLVAEASSKSVGTNSHCSIIAKNVHLR